MVEAEFRLVGPDHEPMRPVRLGIFPTVRNSFEEPNRIQHRGSLPHPPIKLDYSLTGVNATLAVEKGLAEAHWYQCPVPRETMRKLLERRDGPAIRDTIL